MNEAHAFTAREVLEFCRRGARKLRDDPMGPDWVLVWAGTVALLRAVGEALRNVDAARDPKLATKHVSWFEALRESKPEHPIYWKFIVDNRNLLLHEASLKVAGQGISLTPGERSELSYPVDTGFYAGRDACELVDEAIAWWHRELTELGL